MKAAGPVSRILSSLARWTAIPLGKHYCRAQATYPEVWRTESARIVVSHELLPYLVLLRVGFAMRRVSLRVRCALTAPFHPYPSCDRRYLLCGTFRRTPLTAPSRTLSGTPLCGVRTFLPHPRATLANQV